MKIAVISDVHANLEATTACLNKLKELGVDKIICLGDLVDYCAEPNEVISLIKENCDVVVMGNHDEAQFHFELIEGFREYAQVSSIHTRSVILPEYLEYLKTLPYQFSYKNMLFVHGSPHNYGEYGYILNEETAILNFKKFKEEICFIGHSHIPLIFMETNMGAKLVKESDIKKGNRYIINVGSVGQPRDRDPRLSFGIFDTELWNYSNVRVEYDTIIASKKIKNEGLSSFLADRILNGV